MIAEPRSLTVFPMLVLIAREIDQWGVRESLGKKVRVWGVDAGSRFRIDEARMQAGKEMQVAEEMIKVNS